MSWSAYNLIDNFQRKLNLPRSACRAAYQSEAGAAHSVRGQSEIDDVEQIEKFGSKFQNAQLIFSAPPERSVFNQRKIKLMKRRPAERVAAQRSKATLIRSGTAGDLDRYGKKRSIVGAAPEIVFADRPARGKVRYRNQIGTIGAARADARLL